MLVAGLPHTGRFGRTPVDICPTCLSRDCLHRAYRPKLIRFISVHLEVYASALFYPGNASNQLERLDREWTTLPPKHICTCDFRHCHVCKKIDAARPLLADVPVNLGRSHPPGPAMPDPALLDLASVPGRLTPYAVATILCGHNVQDASKSR